MLDDAEVSCAMCFVQACKAHCVHRGNVYKKSGVQVVQKVVHGGKLGLSQIIFRK